VDGGTYYWYGEDRTDPAQTVVSCYSSKDLHHWTHQGKVYSPNDLPQELRARCFIERPKVIYNRKTNRYVLWAHLEQPGYHFSKALVATSTSPTGPFRFERAFRPISEDVGFKDDDPDQQKALGGTFRDMNLFVDDDEKAYVFYASEGNWTMYVVQLDDTYTAPQIPQEQGKTWARILVGRLREAPAPFKYKGRYYLITSGCTGWSPNAADWAVADNILGPYESRGNPCHGPEAALTFRSQSTYVLPLPNMPGCFVFMADRWNPRRLQDSAYIWLPLLIHDDGTVAIVWHDNWDLSVFERLER
jgi:beta-xylosidase